jgi:hypothetical protein
MTDLIDDCNTRDLRVSAWDPWVPETDSEYETSHRDLLDLAGDQSVVGEGCGRYASNGLFN